MSISDAAPLVWHVGGEDVHMRIPLLLRLRERGFQVGAVGSGDETPFAKHKIPYSNYTFTRWFNPLADLQSYRELVLLFSRCRPDLVHAFDTKPAILAMLAARKAGIPGRVRTITGMGYVFSSVSPLALALRPVYRYLQRKASDAASVTVFQNSDDQGYFREHGMVPTGRDVVVHGSGVDVAGLLARCPERSEVVRLRESMAGNGKIVVTMIARMDRLKGVVEYLQAARTVRREGMDVRFLLVGPLGSEGPRAVSRRTIEEFGGDVRYLGPRDGSVAVS